MLVVNLTQTTVTREKETSFGELPSSNWPMGTLSRLLTGVGGSTRGRWSWIIRKPQQAGRQAAVLCAVASALASASPDGGLQSFLPIVTSVTVLPEQQKSKLGKTHSKTER